MFCVFFMFCYLYMLSPTQSFLILFTGFVIIYIINYFYLKQKKTNNQKQIDNRQLMSNIMGTIFIIFGLLKIVNLPKFVEIFNKYDIISQKIPGYAYIYPFIEIALGIAFLKKYKLKPVNYITIFIMVISIISVIISISKGQNLRCGCLGSFLHIPLSYVTITENIVMIIMSSSYLYSYK